MRASLLNRYILSEILPGFLVNILVFSSIMLMARIMTMANLVISKGVGLGVMAGILALALPKILSLTLPMATLLAVLTAFLRLSADSELTVLRASGVSLYQMSPPVLVFGLLATLLTSCLTLWLTPEANWRFKAESLDLAKARADLAIEEQTFVRGRSEFPGLVLYVSQLPPGSDMMSKVFVYDGRSESEASVIVAQRGRLGLDREAGVLLFHLEDGVIDRVYSGRRSTDSIFFDVYELKISPGAELENEKEGGVFRGRQDLPTGELIPVALASDKRSVYLTYHLEWHRRWALPFTTFIMALIGLPLGASFRVRGRNFALIMGLGVFITYYIFFTLGWSLAEVDRIPPWLGVWTSNGLLTIVGLYLFRRINRGVPVDPMELLRRLLTGTGKPRSSSRVKTS
ncbi:MAG: LPS export ABC transporter permease LptF [Candidatus Adiutrix sp.]|jgi:lipopolysaccharide export system permease protein|nr:LPS export ABC transporter permease LptF [Candidatus Adiutrix sp.]